MADYELLGKISLKNVLDRFEKNLFPKINCVKIGKIVSFNSSKQSANVSIEDYPQLSGVPVHFPKGADFSIQFPVKEGDDCIVLFCDTDLDNWVEGKGYIPAFSGDVHGLNGAVALVGISNSATKIDDYSTNGLKIKYKDTYVDLQDTQTEIKCGENNVKIDSTGITLTVGATILQVSSLGVNITGNLVVSGTIGAASISAGGVSMADGDITAGDIGLKTHTHTYTKAQSAQSLVSVTDNTSVGV